jgi:hypothetical protein
MLQSELTSSPFRLPEPDTNLMGLSDLVPPPVITTGGISAPKLRKSRELMLYAAGAIHLRDFSRMIGAPIFKLGVTSTDPQRRIDGLSENRYAGLWGRSGPSSGSEMVELAGADNWFPIAIGPSSAPADNTDHKAPVRLVDNRYIAFEVAGSVGDDLVNRALNSVFQNRCLRRFLHSDEGQLRITQARIDPSKWFHTRYAKPSGQPDRISAVQELFILDPAREKNMIVEALQAMVAYLNRSA